jgi:hypothetical protein
MVFQACEHCLGVLVQQIASTDDHHIEATQERLVAAKAFANQALDAIALNRPADLLTRDRQPQTRQLAATLPRQYSEPFVTGFLWVLEYAFVVSGSQEAHTPLESQTRPRTWQGFEPKRQADSRTRPLARLALITLRPALVAMRARKPWRRFRFSLLG